MHATDAEMMTPRQRLEEIADILAGGFLRLRGRRGYVAGAKGGAEQAGENTSPSSAELTGCPVAPSA